MEFDDTSPRKRQHLIQAAALIALVTTTALVAFPLQRGLKRLMEEFKEGIVLLLEEATGREITFSRFSPSILRYVEIRDLRILSTDHPDSTLLSVNRVRVYFNLIAFLRGERERSLKRVSVEDTTFSIDLDEDRDLVDLYSSIVSARDGNSATPADGRIPGVVLSGRNLTVIVSSGDSTVRAERLFFDLDTGGPLYFLSLAADLEASSAEESVFARVATTIDLDASVNESLDLMNGRVSFSGLETADFVLSDQTFQVRLQDERWTLRKIQDRLPLDLEIGFLPSTARLSVTLSTERFAPLSLVTPKGRFEELTRFLEVETSGNASVELGLDGSGLSYRADLVTIVPYDFLPETLTVRSVFHGTDESVHIGSLRIDSTVGRLTFDGSVAFGSIQPTGTIEFTEVTYPLGRPISGRGTIAYRDGVITLDAPSIVFDGQSLTDVSFLVRQREDGADFAAAVTLGSAGTAHAEGSIDLFDDRSIDLEATLRSIPTDRLYSLLAGSSAELPLADLISGTTFDASVFLQSDFERISFSIPALTAANIDRDFSISLVASGNTDEIRVGRLEARYAGELVGGQVTLRLEGDGLASVTGTADYRGTPYRFVGEYDRETGIFLTGDYRLDAAILTADSPTRFRFACARLPVPVAGHTVMATVRSTGSFASTDRWNVEIAGASFEGIPIIPTGTIDLSVKGTISDRAVALPEITISDAFSTVFGRLDAQYTFTGGFAVDGNATIGNQASGEAYSVSGSYTNESLRLDLEFSGSPLSRFGDLPLTGRLSGAGIVSGPPAAPNISASITVDEGRLNEGSIALSGSFDLNERRLVADELRIDLKNSVVRDGRLELDFTDSSFSAAAHYTGVLKSQPLEALVEANGRFDAAMGNRNLALIAESPFEGLIAVRSIEFGEPERPDWVFTVRRSDDTLSLSGGLEQSMTGTISLDGSFDLLLRDPLPVSMSASGRISDGEIESILSSVRVDMEGIESIVTIPFFNVTSGIASSGSNQIRISGRLNDPDIYGELEARGLLARVDVVPEAIGPFDARLSFQGKKLVIDNALLPIGRGAVRTYADFTLDHWLPGAYEIELVTDPTNRNGLHIKHNFGSIKVDGYGNGVLTVTGDDIATRLDGDLTIRNTDIQLGDPIPAGDGAGGPGLVVDIRFTTDRQVTFYWPSVNLPVVRSSAATGQLLRLRSNSLDGSLAIEGDIAVRGGDIFYFKRSFYLREGNIRFRENEDRFDPFITVRAETKDRGDDGEDITLYLIVDNQPFSEFNPRFESDPPMAGIDILTRLGRSIVPTAGEEPALSSAILLTTDVLSQFGIFRNVEQRIRTLLQLDLFSIRTQIIQNILSDQVLPNSADPFPNQPSIGRYLDNTTLFLGKYFGNDLFVEAMFRLKSNQALFSDTGMYGDLYVDSEIRLEWRTPLFLLEFSILPNLADPFSSITRSSIGLSWDF